MARVDSGPYVRAEHLSICSRFLISLANQQGPSGRLDQPVGATKEDFFASILRSSGSNQSDSSRSRRQSRVSREQVSSSQGPLMRLPLRTFSPHFSELDRGLSVVPTREWQDNLSTRLTSSGSRIPSFDVSGVPLAQRRRLNGTLEHVPSPPDWKNMYTLESSGAYNVSI